MTMSTQLQFKGFHHLLLLLLLVAVSAASVAKHRKKSVESHTVVKHEKEAGKQHPAEGYVMNQWDSSWPSANVRASLGQIGGVAEDADDNVFVFHRAERVWDADDFNEKYSYVRAKYGPIQSNTIVILNPESKIVNALGNDMFYLPHGITLDPKGNIWVTDVALHQVLKFSRGQRSPSLSLGKKLIPGSDDQHFCQPTSVAVAKSGEIFVADGYCNSRIMKFAPNKTLLHKWGRQWRGNESLANDHLSVPHSITLIEEKDLLCVADREHKRVQCYKAGLEDPKVTGQFVFSLANPEFGLVYAVNYNPEYDVLLVLGSKERVSRGFIYDMRMHKFIDNFDYPARNGFGYGHTLSSSSSGSSLVVGGLTKECPDLDEPACRVVETSLDQNLWRFNMYGTKDLAEIM